MRTGKLPKAVGMYIFAGGFTLGVRRRFNVLAHLEDGPFGAAESRLNLGVTVHEDPNTWPVATLRAQGVDLVYCNPPCAPFSACNVGGKGDGWRSDPRVGCIRNCYEYGLERMRPLVWTFESVRGAYTRGRSMVDDMAARAERLGYRCYHVLTEARHHGVPQTRRRYFMVLSRVDIDWPPTGKEHVGAGREIDRLTRKTGPGAVKASPEAKVRLLKHVSPGEHLRDVFDAIVEEKAELNGALPQERNAKGGIVGRPAGIEYRCHPDRQTPGAVGSMPMYHHREPRLLGVNEVKALCGFPQDYRLPESPAAAYDRMLKGVMPPVAEYMADAIADAIKRRRWAAPGACAVVTIGQKVTDVQEELAI